MKAPVVDKGWCWVMLLCVALNYFVIFGTFFSFGIWYPRLIKEFGSTQAEAAWVGSMASGLLALLASITIVFCNRFGVAATSIIGSMLCGTGIITTSYLHNIHHLYITYGVVFGVGSSLVYTPILIMVGRWFKKYQAAATTFVVCSAPAGSLVLNPLMEFIMERYELRSVMRCYGILYLTITLLASLSYIPFMDMFIDKSKQEDSIELNGGDDSNNDNDTESNKAECCNYTKDNSSKVDTKQARDTGFIFKRELFKNKSYLFSLASISTFMFAHYVPHFFLVKYAYSYGISGSTASLLMTMWSVCNLIGRISYGKFISRYRSKLLITFQVSMFMSGIVSIAACLADKTWSLLLYVCIYGFFDASNIGLASLVTYDLTSREDLGPAWGIQQTFTGIPRIMGPVIVATMNDSGLLPKQFMFIFNGLCFIIGSLFMHFARRYQKETYIERISEDLKRQLTEEISNEN